MVGHNANLGMCVEVGILIQKYFHPIVEKEKLGEC